MATASTTARLFRNILVRGASDVLNAVIGLVIIALVARQLTTAAFGIYTQVVTTASLLLPLLTLRLNTATVRFFASVAREADVRRRHFSTILLTVLALSGLAIGVLYAASDLTARVVFGEPVGATLVLCLGMYLALRSIVTLFTDYFRAANRPSLASAYNTLRFITNLAFLSVAVWRDVGVVGVLLAYIATETVFAAVLALHLLRDRGIGLRGVWVPRELKPYFAYSLPLLPYSMFLTINQFADRYFITHLVGLEATGIYGFSYNLIMSAFLLNASIAYVIYPHLCRLWEDGDMTAVRAQLEAGQRLFVFVAVPVASGFCTIYPALVTLMAGREFVLEPLALGAIVAGQFMLGLCSLFGFIIDLSKRTTFFVKVLCVTATINLALNALLVPSMGIAGAALATLVTYAAQLVMLWYTTQEMAPFRVRIDFPFMASCAVLAAIMVAAVQVLQPIVTTTDILMSIALAVVVYAACALLLFRHRLHELRQLLGGN